VAAEPTPPWELETREGPGRACRADGGGLDLRRLVLLTPVYNHIRSRVDLPVHHGGGMG
jgi:hypothetical protein